MKESEECPVGKTTSLSALLDGEIDESEVAALCATWRRDERQRADWRAYHLIGDVLRSDELSPDPAREQAFLSALHERLAREPVVLDRPAATPVHQATATVPASTGTASNRTGLPRARALRRWAAPVGLAAGVVMVAAVVLVTRTQTPGTALAWWAPEGSATAASATAVDQDSLAQAELLHYLRAHKEYPGAATLTPAAGYLRNAAYETGAR